MAAFWLSALVVGTSLVTALPQSNVVSVVPSSSALSEAPSCVNDELLLLLKRNLRWAYPYCRSFLDVQTSTEVSTIEVTPSPVIEYTTEATTTTNIESTTVTEVETSTAISYGTTTTTKTITTRTPPVASPSVTALKARGENFSSALSQHPLESLSSACICLYAPRCAKKTTTTTTLPPSTLLSSLLTTTTTSTTLTLTSLSTTTTTTPLILSTATTTTHTTPTPSTFRLYALFPNETRLYVGKQSYGPTWVHLRHDGESPSTAQIFSIDAQSRLVESRWTPGDGVLDRYAYYDNTWFRTENADPNSQTGNSQYVVFIPPSEFGGDYPNARTYVARVDAATGELRMKTQFDVELRWSARYEMLPFGERGEGPEWYGTSWRFQLWRWKKREGSDEIKMMVEWIPIV
ncbi:hypothetical protein QBC34DRAFT_499073 [Podospora aff. communis PSN243]|uniref:Uncharacterized protein n=1 Tax=Podospora aff. communis PSN243 TaxID=3040156 RepID=A0AAV9G532_9PEZI|nr:hypothetical protein QBC34DRAFT_499073 [Podospora aff. communis PSN243]